MQHERDQHPETSIHFEDVVGNAKEVLLAAGRHEATLIIEGTQQTIGVLLKNVPTTHDERLRQMFMAGFAVAQAGDVGILKQVFFTTEAWMSTAEGGKIPDVPPSEDPNRREILLVTQLRFVDNQSRVATIEMMRDTEGHLRELREFAPEEDRHAQIESPLLVAFVYGFAEGLLMPPPGDDGIRH